MLGCANAVRLRSSARAPRRDPSAAAKTFTTQASPVDRSTAVYVSPEPPPPSRSPSSQGSGRRGSPPPPTTLATATMPMLVQRHGKIYSPIVVGSPNQHRCGDGRRSCNETGSLGESPKAGRRAASGTLADACAVLRDVSERRCRRRDARFGPEPETPPNGSLRRRGCRRRSSNSRPLPGRPGWQWPR